MCEKHPNQVTAEKLIEQIHECSKRVQAATSERMNHTAAVYQICPHTEVVQFFQVNLGPEWTKQNDAFVVRACTTCGMHEEHTVRCSSKPMPTEFDSCTAFKKLSAPKNIRHVSGYAEINKAKLYPGAP